MNNLFFNSDFYPTPENVLNLMGINPFDKVVLEPHGGSGAIIDWLNNNGAKRVLTCEKHPELAKIAASKADEFLSDDFLKVVDLQVSHVDLIVMNPPFSNAATHIMKAWEIAPSGCEIISLINTENLDEDKKRQSEDLKQLLATPYQRIDLGACFQYADRKTNVEVSVISFKKPVNGEKIDWSIFTDEPDSLAEEEGITPYNEILAIVSSYVYSCKMYEDFAKSADLMNSANDFLGNIRPVKAGVFRTAERGGLQMISEHEYRATLQKACWKKIFATLKINKYLSSGVIKEVNRFSEQQSKVPFTLKNVYTMIDVLFQTREESLKKGLVEAVNSFTRGTHKNRYGVEGWKTNLGYMLNKKIIIPRAIDTSDYWQDYPHLNHFGDAAEKMDDLIKSMCFIVGFDYDEHIKLGQVFNGRDKQFGKWYCFGFFQVRAYKKGTIHVKFNSEKQWELLNRAYAKALGQILPEKI